MKLLLEQQKIKNNKNNAHKIFRSLQTIKKGIIMKKRKITFNEFKNLVKDLIKEQSEKKIDGDTGIPQAQPQPEMSDELKTFVAEVAQIKKLLVASADKIRKMENEKKESLSNEHKRTLGKFYYDIDLIVSELDTFRNEYVEENIAST
jgi:Mg2+ and Co2+ transporter CorA